MGGGLAIAGTSIAAALCCLAIPITAGIVGLGDLAAFGTNVGIVAVVVAGALVLMAVRTRSRSGGDPGASDG
jgi:hypothetical protein